jgi:hypothetical protein
MRTQLDLFALMGTQMILGGLMMCVVGAMTGELPRWHWSGPLRALLPHHPHRRITDQLAH